MFIFYFFTTPGRALLVLGPLTLTWEGLLAGVRQIYRLCLLVIVSSLLTFTTSPVQLSHGLEAVLGPLVPLGLPVRELAMVMTIALRFVLIMSAEIEGITKAQEARGAHIRSGNLWQRLTFYRTCKDEYGNLILDGTNNACERSIGWCIKERYRTMRGYKREQSALNVSRLIAFAGNHRSRGLSLAGLVA